MNAEADSRITPPAERASNYPASDDAKLPRVSMAALAAVMCIAVSVVLFGAVIIIALTTSTVREYLAEVLAVTIAIHALVCLLGLVALLRRAGVTPAQVGITRPTRRMAHLLWQIPCAVIILVAVQAGIFAALGENEPVSNSSTSDGMAGLSPVFALVGFIGITVLTPLWEELFFRGILLSSIRLRWGVGLAVAVSSALFAAAHGVPILLPYMLTLGIILAVLRIFHDSLWASLAMHVTINTIASVTILTALG